MKSSPPWAPPPENGEHLMQHDDEPRRAPSAYVPFIPGSDRPRPNRAQRRAAEQVRARARRRTERATVRALRAVEATPGAALYDADWDRIDADDHPGF